RWRRRSGSPSDREERKKPKCKHHCLCLGTPEEVLSMQEPSLTNAQEVSAAKDCIRSKQAEAVSKGEAIVFLDHYLDFCGSGHCRCADCDATLGYVEDVVACKKYITGINRRQYYLICDDCLPQHLILCKLEG